MLDACGPIDLLLLLLHWPERKVVIEGVGFWDERHGQTGVAQRDRATSGLGLQRQLLTDKRLSGLPFLNRFNPSHGSAA